MPYIPGYAPDLVRKSAEFTRPADTTAYAAGDVVGTSPAAFLTFASLAKHGAGQGRVRSARIQKSGATVTSATFRLYLYRSQPTTAAVADNAAWPVAYADRDILIGWLDFATMTSQGGGGGIALLTGQDLPFRFTSGQTLYGVLTAQAAYAPASAETFAIELQVERF